MLDQMLEETGGAPTRAEIREADRILGVTERSARRKR
jgi:hypothetical protein